MAAEPHGTDRLPRSLGVWSAAAVLVGSTIGSGIFRTPANVAADVGTVGAVALVWILGGLVAVFGALTLAELATMYPRSGGVFVYVREGFGPMPAFLFGWTEMIVIRPSALGAIAMIFAEYMQTFVKMSDGQIRLVAAIAIVILGGLNVFSLRYAALLENVTTAAKVMALLGLTVLAFVFGKFSSGALAGGHFAFSPTSWAGFGIALVSVMWAYDGWADLTFVAGEVKDPSRNLPRALLWGVATIVVVYLAINLAYLWVLPMDVMAHSPLVASDTAIRIFGQAGAAIVAALVMLSAFGALNGSMMTGPRIFWAMADENLFFKPVAAVHPRFRTPHVAIGMAVVLGVLYVSLRTFEQLADQFILGIWPFYALAVAAVFVLRKRAPHADRPYRTAGYPLVPLVFLIASVAMLGNALFTAPGPTMICFGVILAGIPVYYAWKRPHA
jgi:amino acid transporter